MSFRTSTLSVQMPPGSICSDPPEPPGQGHGKGQVKGKAKKCERFFQPGGGGGGKPDCPPGWLKKSEDGTCQHPGQGSGNGGNNNSNNGDGGGGGNGGGNGNGQEG